MADRCPHRLAPLSMGRLVGDAVECGYHGITFDCTGKCIRIPGEGRILERFAATAYPAFYPGGPGISLVRQWAQSGLAGKVPLFSNIALSEPLVFQAQGKTALGIVVTGNYFAEIDNPENKRFVEVFRGKHKRDPASFAGLQYDAVMLLDAAVREVKGNLKNQDAFRAALKKASFKSVRGPFRFNNNNHPIQNTYIGVVDQRQDGSMYIRLTGTLRENAPDNFAAKCPMKS